MDADPAPAAVDIGPVHLVPEVLGLERVFADEHVGQAGRGRVRKRALDAPLHGHRVGVDLAVSGDPGVGRDLDDQGVLTAVALGLHLGQAEVDGLDAGDLQVARWGGWRGHARSSCHWIMGVPLVITGELERSQSRCHSYY